MIDMRKAVFDFSFLDCLSDDYLKCAQSIQTDSDKTVSNKRIQFGLVFFLIIKLILVYLEVFILDLVLKIWIFLLCNNKIFFLNFFFNDLFPNELKKYDN